MLIFVTCTVVRCALLCYVAAPFFVVKQIIGFLCFRQSVNNVKHPLARWENEKGFDKTAFRCPPLHVCHVISVLYLHHPVAPQTVGKLPLMKNEISSKWNFSALIVKSSAKVLTEGIMCSALTKHKGFYKLLGLSIINHSKGGNTFFSKDRLYCLLTMKKIVEYKVIRTLVKGTGTWV